MDYEKKYKEAQKWIESIYSELSHEQQMEAEAFFPELKESEDERIRKRIIHALHGDVLDMEETTKAISWLEKQGEPKETICDKCKKDQSFHSCQDITALGRCYIEGMNSSNNLESKFKVGDEIRTKNEESLIITRIDRCGYWSEDLLICNFDDADKWELVEQKPAWSEEDEKRLQSCINILKAKSLMGKVDTANTMWLKSLKQRIGG